MACAVVGDSDELMIVRHDELVSYFYQTSLISEEVCIFMIHGMYCRLQIQAK